MYGPILDEASLKNVGYSEPFGFDSSWGDLGNEIVGIYILMAWSHGFPSGIGCNVTLGEDISLPIRSTDLDDRNIKIITSFQRINTKLKVKT